MILFQAADLECTKYRRAACTWSCLEQVNKTKIAANGYIFKDHDYNFCVEDPRNVNTVGCPSNVNLTCRVLEKEDCLYGTITFWGFVALMSIGTIGFNVANCVSDAICFDVLGR